jgi:hypothetical protein
MAGKAHHLGAMVAVHIDFDHKHGVQQRLRQIDAEALPIEKHATAGNRLLSLVENTVGLFGTFRN